MNCLLSHVSIIFTLSPETTSKYSISSLSSKLHELICFQNLLNIAQRHIIEYICNPSPMDIMDVIYRMPNVPDV